MFIVLNFVLQLTIKAELMLSKKEAVSIPVTSWSCSINLGLLQAESGEKEYFK